MDELITLLIPAVLTIFAVRLLLLPMKGILKFSIHSASGFLCLWLLNAISTFTGIYFPINAATVLIAGFLGLPGIGIMALLAVL